MTIKEQETDKKQERRDMIGTVAGLSLLEIGLWASYAAIDKFAHKHKQSFGEAFGNSIKNGSAFIIFAPLAAIATSFGVYLDHQTKKLRNQNQSLQEEVQQLKGNASLHLPVAQYSADVVAETPKTSHRTKVGEPMSSHAAQIEATASTEPAHTL